MMRVAIVGTGAVARWFGRKIEESSGYTFLGYISRQLENKELSHKVFHLKEELPEVPEILIFAVKDAALHVLPNQLLHLHSAVALHTSGSTPLNVLDAFASAGVIYPFMTFSKKLELNVVEVPLYIDYKVGCKSMVKSLASSISAIVEECNEEQRKRLHLAGTLVSNFTVALMSMAENQLVNAGYKLSAIQLLLQQTLQNISANGAKESLTGPASRGDTQTMAAHIQLIDTVEEAEVYNAMSRLIIHLVQKGQVK